MTFSIVIPLFNEEKNIKNLIDEIYYFLEKQTYDYEIVLVNDGSTDETKKIIEEIKNKNPYKIKLLKNSKNFGQSFSLINGINKSKFDTIISLDGDGQNNPKDIPRLINKYISNKDVSLVGGIRVNRKDSFIKKISSVIANKIRIFFLNDGCLDTGCSLKIFEKNTFLLFPKFNGIHRFLPALFKGYGKKTMYIEVDHRLRKHGISKYGTISRMLKGIIDIIRVLLIIKKYNKKNA